LEPAAVGERIERLGQTVDAIAVVAANHPRIVSAIDRLEGGIPFVALIFGTRGSEPDRRSRVGQLEGRPNNRLGRGQYLQTAL
jgi:ABC-type sugar transport system substrate-binding protein